MSGDQRQSPVQVGDERRALRLVQLVGRHCEAKLDLCHILQIDLSLSEFIIIVLQFLRRL